MLFLSFCAGVGEELLFRGAIQPWLGIWLTALLFIFYTDLNPKDKPLLYMARFC
ncbi:MAG: CPBP family intramembrane metalloprotease [Bacteroidetes bacterium]|nr:CPBP family intramembrane metalloprotease [Bacteroidota bacterium]